MLPLIMTGCVASYSTADLSMAWPYPDGVGRFWLPERNLSTKEKGKRKIYTPGTCIRGNLRMYVEN